MPKEAKKLLENVSLGVAAQVAATRLKNAGVVVEHSLHRDKKADAGAKVPKRLIKSLAGV